MGWSWLDMKARSGITISHTIIDYKATATFFQRHGISHMLMG